MPYSSPLIGKSRTEVREKKKKVIFSEQLFKVAKHCNTQPVYTWSILYVFKHQLLKNSKVLCSTQKEEKKR